MVTTKEEDKKEEAMEMDLIQAAEEEEADEVASNFTSPQASPSTMEDGTKAYWHRASPRVTAIGKALLLYLLLAAIACTSSMAWLFHHREQQVYQDALSMAAQARDDGLAKNIHQMLASLQVLAIDIQHEVSRSGDNNTNMTWP